MQPIVALEGVSRTYGTGHTLVRALGPIDFRVSRGEFVAVMGPSGSGKSTLLALAGGLDRPSEGRILIDGQDLAELDGGGLAKLRRRRVDYVFQNLNLLAGLTSHENVALPLELDGATWQEARREALFVLAVVGLRPLENRYPDELSGGVPGALHWRRDCHPGHPRRNAVVTGNSVNTLATVASVGIRLVSEDDALLRARVEDNTVSGQTSGHGFRVLTHDDAGRVHLVLRDNSVTTTSSSPAYALEILQDSYLCGAISGNTGSSNHPSRDLFVDLFDATASGDFEGAAVGSLTQAALEAFLTSQNPDPRVGTLVNGNAFGVAADTCQRP